MERITTKFRLDGRVALITGASKGIGAAIAKGLGEFGATVVICSRQQEAVDKVAAELVDSGIEALAFQCHVGREDDRLALIGEIKKRFGRLDVLVNNAGTNPYYGPLLEMPEVLYRKTMEVNTEAAMHLSNLAHPLMKDRGTGSIIHISSVEGLHASAMMAAYNMSKSALIMLGQNQAVEWAPDGIRVNIICPGLVRTKLSNAFFTDESITDRITSRILLKRAAEPEEMAGLVCFLASDAASYMTGAVSVIDGGMLLAPLFS